jgi:membrane protease YdiL (CAAX protease family)
MIKNKIALKFVALTFLIAWSCWLTLIFLVDHHFTKYGDLVFMGLYLSGGICPSIAGILVIRSDRAAFKMLKADTFRFKVNIIWYAGIIVIPVLLSGFAWLLHTAFFGRTGGQFLTNNLFAAILILPVMIIGGGSEEVGWRGVLLPQLLNKMPAFNATIIVAAIWGIWHAPLWFIQGVPQYGSSFIFFICGTFSLSFLLTVIYVRTKSVFVCILFHATANAYLYIGLDSWPKDITGGIMIAATALIISIAIFKYLALDIKPKLPQPSKQSGLTEK